MSGFEGAAGPGRPARDGLTKAGCWCQRFVLGKQGQGEGKTSGLKPESRHRAEEED